MHSIHTAGVDLVLLGKWEESQRCALGRETNRHILHRKSVMAWQKDRKRLHGTCSWDCTFFERAILDSFDNVAVFF